MASTDIKFTVMLQGAQEQFYEFSLPSDTDMATLKLIVETQSTIKSAQQQLYFQDKFISSDTETLKSLNISNNDVIVVKTGSTNKIDLGMPVFSPFGDIPQMPKWLTMNAKELQSIIRNDGTMMQQLLHSNPTFAQALLSDDLTLLNGYLGRIRNEFNQKVQREQYRRAQLNADPLNPEYQKQIMGEFQQENINQNYATAVEEMPEAFGRVVMLYVPMEIEGVKVNAFIDSGAQSTIMSKEYAEKCNLMRLVDTRFAGIAKGVGTAKIIGRVHIAKIKFGNIYLPSSFTILDQKGMDFLFGLDMLRRHQGCIDLQKNVLRIGTEEVPFLQEKDIPHLREEAAAAKLQQQQQQQPIDEDAALQNALLQSAQATNTNNDANKNKNSNNNSNNNNSSSSDSASSGSAMNVDSSSSSNANTNNSNNNNNNTGNDLMSTILGALGGSNANNNNNNGGGNNNGTAASSGFNENDITTLTNLGYSQTQAQQALRACGGNVEMAASYLFQAFGGGLGF